MNLDRVSAVIRPRSYPEAIDLGFCMVRAWWRPIVGAWMAAGVPLLLLLVAAFFRYPEIALLVVWWLKPLFDRAPLFVVSRALFGDAPTTAQTLRGWSAMLGRQLLGPLTGGRLDPLRSFRMPVRLLEQQEKQARRMRWQVLVRGVRGEASMLTTSCALFELTLFFGLVLTLSSFGLLPGLASSLGPDSVFDVPLVERWMLVGCWILAAAFVEPFYVAGGFGLYVNRRTHLEAWDIEVAFRRMSSRVNPRAAVALLLLAIGTAALLPGSAIRAQEPDPRATIEQVLADPVFGGTRTETTWAPRSSDSDTPPPTPGLGALGLLISWFVRGSVIALAIAFLAWGIYRLSRRGVGIVRSSEKEDEPLPEEILGLDVRGESLPIDIGGDARELWEAGRRVEAIRLLYRGALHRLIGDGLPIKPSATEGDCLRLAAVHLPEARQAYFQSLTGMWLLSAYGRREPDEDTGSELVRDWGRIFGEPS